MRIVFIFLIAVFLITISAGVRFVHLHPVTSYCQQEGYEEYARESFNLFVCVGEQGFSKEKIWCKNDILRTLFNVYTFQNPFDAWNCKIINEVER